MTMVTKPLPRQFVIGIRFSVDDAFLMSFGNAHHPAQPQTIFSNIKRRPEYPAKVCSERRFSDGKSNDLFDLSAQ